MAWIVVTLIGSWMLLSAFILVVICMNSSRISQVEEPALRRRAYQARLSRGRFSAQLQASQASQSMD